MPCGFCKDTNFVVFILIAIFGAGSWMPVSGIWVELPLLVPQLPESWRLPSYFSIIIQVANIGPITFSIINHFFKDFVNERIVIFVLLAVNIASCFMLPFFWKTTINIGGESHSVVLLAILFCLAIVSSSSAVIFVPFMAVFKPQYLTAYCFGQTFTGLIPSLFVLGQGAGKSKCVNTTSSNLSLSNDSNYNLEAVYQEPRFSFEVFQYIMLSMTGVFLITYVLLLYLPVCKRQYAKLPNEIELDILSAGEKLMDTQENTTKPKTKDTFSSYTIYLLIMNGWLSCLMQGILFPIQSYSCLPYGNEVYHLTVALMYAGNPIASFMTFVFPSVKTSVITTFTIVANITAVYILYGAVSSPVPILYESGGSVLMMIAWIITSSLVVFCIVSIANKLRKIGRNALRWYGLTLQLGGLFGSILMYVLINVADTFTISKSCARH